MYIRLTHSYPCTQDDTAEDKKGDEQNTPDDSTPETCESYGTKSHDAPGVEQTTTANDQTSQQQEDENQSEGTGTAQADLQQGHEGESSSKVAQGQSEGSKKQVSDP